MNPYRSLRGLPRPLFVLALATLANRVGTMVLPFLVLYLHRSRGLSAGAAAAVVALYGGVGLLAAPLGGRAADRFGAGRVAVGCLVLSAGALMLFPLMHTVPAIAVATVALALVTESYRPAAMALYGQLAPADKRKQVFALRRLAANLGMAVGPAAAGWLASWRFDVIFYVDGATSLIAAAIMARALGGRGPSDAPHAVASAADEPAASAPSRGGAPRSAPPGAPVSSGGAALRIGQRVPPSFWLFLAGTLTVSLVFFQIDAALPLYMVRELHLPTSAFGLLFTVNTVIIITVEVPLTAAAAHWPVRRALVVGGLLLSGGFAASGLATGLWTMIATVVVWTFGEMILLPVSSAYVVDVAPPARVGRYTGLYSMCFGLGFALAPWGGTRVLEQYGSMALWSMVLAVGLLGTALFATVRDSPPATA